MLLLFLVASYAAAADMLQRILGKTLVVAQSPRMMMQKELVRWLDPCFYSVLIDVGDTPTDSDRQPPMMRNLGRRVASMLTVLSKII